MPVNIKNRFTLSSFALALLLPTTGVALERYYFSGSLDERYPIQLDLARTADGREWVGHYLLQDGSGKPVAIHGPYEDGRIELTPESPAGIPGGSGRFEGELQEEGQRLTGTRTNTTNEAPTPFRLNRVARYRERTLTQPRPFPEYDCPCTQGSKDYVTPPPTDVQEADAAGPICICNTRETLIYPRFDGPAADDLEDALSHHTALTSGDEAAGTTEVQIQADIWFHTQDLISLRVHRRLFYPFSADTRETVRSINLAMPASGPIRELGASDLITPSPACRTRINDAILDELRKQQAPAVVDPEFWGTDLTRLHEAQRLIGPAGLTFLLEPSAVGPYDTGAYHVDIPYNAIADCIPDGSPIARLARMH